MKKPSVVFIACLLSSLSEARTIEESVLDVLNQKSAERAEAKRESQRQEALLNFVKVAKKDCQHLQKLENEGAQLVKEAQEGNSIRDLLGLARTNDKETSAAKLRIQASLDQSLKALSTDALFMELFNLHTKLLMGAIGMPESKLQERQRVLSDIQLLTACASSLATP